MKKNNKYGFTLIELLVTITIIGIISVMALPQISKMQSSNIQRKCEVFKSSFLSAGKVYNSSYEEDLFGDIPSGCVEVPFKDVQGKKLIKDIQIDNGTCNPNEASFIRIRKANDKYRYEVFMRCTQNNQEIFATDNFPPTADCTLTVEGDTSPPTITPSIKFKGSNVNSSTTYTVEDKNEVKASVTLNDSGSGMAATNKISYIWKIGTSIKSSGTETKNTTAGAGSVSINIPVPDTIATQSGTYILEVTPVDVKDAVGNILGNANKKTKTIKVYIDTTAPTIETDITYKDKSVDSSKTYTITNKKDVEAYVTLKDNKYGLANSNKVTYKWTRSNTKVSGDTLTVTASGYPKTKKATIPVPAAIAKTAGTYKLEITATDVKNKKGNKTPTNTKVSKSIKVKMKSSSTTPTPTPTPTTTTTPKQCIPTTPTVSMKAGKNAYKNNTWVGSNVAVSASSDACTTKYEYYNTSTKKTGTGASFTATNGITKFKYRACSSDGCSGYTSEYTVKVDTVAPSKPTVIGYIKTSNTNISAHGKLTKYTANTWINKWVFTEASESTDSGSGNIKYYMSASGAGGTENNKQQGYRNVNAEGASTVTFKACDAAGNCSGGTSITVKLDRTAPSKPTVTGYIKKSSTNISSHNKLSKYTSGEWTNKWVLAYASGSKDTYSGVNYYMSASGDGGTENNKQQGYRNVNTHGKSTVSFKACDGAGNCSGSNSISIKLDHKAPTLVSYHAKKKKDGYVHFYIKFKDDTGLNTVNRKKKTDGKLYYCYNGTYCGANNICTSTKYDKVGKSGKRFDVAKIDNNLADKTVDTVEIKTSYSCGGSKNYPVYIVIYGCDQWNNCAWQAKDSPKTLKAHQTSEKNL